MHTTNDKCCNKITSDFVVFLDNCDMQIKRDKEMRYEFFIPAVAELSKIK